MIDKKIKLIGKKTMISFNMDNKELEKTLFFHNPWWKEKKVPKVFLPDFERPVLNKIKRYLDKLERIIIVKGPRRTGKTTILYQIIHFLLGKGINPFDVLFLSFDDPSLKTDLDKIIRTYQEIRGKTINQGEIYCFLDEVHFLDNWQFIVKKYFDKKHPIKFLISSSSASLFKKGLESLAGRTVEEIVLPFSFKEIVLYHFRYNKHFLEFFEKKQITPYEDEIKILFNNYLSKGGFPHILSVEEPFLRQKLLREDILEKAIYRDLVSLYSIREPQKLEKMFSYLSDISGQILNISNLSKNIGLSRMYTENYLNYLEKAYLVFRFNNFSLSSGKKIRTPSKVYLVDSGLIDLFGNTSPDFLLESVVARELLEKEGAEIYYFRNFNEVDFILKEKQELIPIEVKNKDELKSQDFKSLLYFMEKFKVRKGILLSRETFEERSYGQGLKIKILPTWYWLLFKE